MIKIQYDGDCKGNVYTFYPAENAWYCTESRCWRHRWIKVYAIKACTLKKIAESKGYDTHQAWIDTCPKPTIKTSSGTKKKSVKAKQSSSFISLF